ncbi:hypothetical protein [Trichothermofontia sp.]
MASAVTHSQLSADILRIPKWHRNLSAKLDLIALAVELSWPWAIAKPLALMTYQE